MRASVKKDHLVCLDCGKKMKMLKRHLATRYNMTPEQFRITLRNDVATEGLAIITSSAAGEASQESDWLRGSFFSGASSLAGCSPGAGW